MEHMPLGFANEQSKTELLNPQLKTFICVSFKMEFKASVHPSSRKPSFLGHLLEHFVPRRLCDLVVRAQLWSWLEGGCPMD